MKNKAKTQEEKTASKLQHMQSASKVETLLRQDKNMYIYTKIIKLKKGTSGEYW